MPFVVACLVVAAEPGADLEADGRFEELATHVLGAELGELRQIGEMGERHLGWSVDAYGC
jgi:hypothetical protein